jgi:septum formation inhibitor-activating ATPase MinD
MVKIEDWAHIQGGKLVLGNRKRFEAEIKNCQDCDVIVTVKKRGKRSTQQNRYYWGICIAEIRLRLRELGYRMTAEDIHSMLKLKFIPVTLRDGEVLIATMPGSTAELNKSEMMEYLEQVIQWAQDTLEITIPPSDKTLSMDF